MTADELREKVALVLCQTALGHKKCPCSESGRFGCAAEHPGKMADAAIAIVLEEAAKALMAVERYDIDTDYCSLDKTADGELMHAEDAFAAIRALTGQKEET